MRHSVLAEQGVDPPWPTPGIFRAAVLQRGSPVVHGRMPTAQVAKLAGAPNWSRCPFARDLFSAERTGPMAPRTHQRQGHPTGL